MKLKQIAAAAALIVVGASANAYTTEAFGAYHGGTGTFEELSSFTVAGIASALTGTLSSFELFAGETATGTALASGTLFPSQKNAFFGPSTVFSAGVYTFLVKGNGNVNYAFETTAAVPEPETYALMLAGIGVIGFMARRRNMS